VSIEPGTLYVVATPIGNLGDLSPRAVTVLGGVDLVAAEDTRHTQRLLSHLGLSVRLCSLHEHNEGARLAGLLQLLAERGSVALVSDAGTPLISDPGFRLVRAAQEQGYPVRPIPGPCSPVAALSVAGLPSDRFVFEGFLPSRAPARSARLQELAGETRTLVFLEAPHRVEATLLAMARVLGAEREAALARELTKLHEQVVRADLGELCSRVATTPELRRGEIVLLVRGREQANVTSEAEVRRLLALLATELPPARAAALAARITGRARRELYELVRELAGEP
jgi:16S rRNA (cytidine1402-2'-O)-methyltransferase